MIEQVIKIQNRATRYTWSAGQVRLGHKVLKVRLVQQGVPGISGSTRRPEVQPVQQVLQQLNNNSTYIITEPIVVTNGR